MSSIAHSGKTQNLIIYPQIAAQAIQQGHASAYRLYSVVQDRARSTQGRSIFSRAEIHAYCDTLGVMNPQQIDRALRDGIGLCWNYLPSRGVYQMISRAKVAAALGVDEPGQAVLLPVTAFTGRLGHWKAMTYAAYLAQLRQVTPSRETLQAVFGVSLPTLLDWERRTGVRVTARIVLVEMPEGEQDRVYSQSIEIESNRSARVWVSLMTQRGRIIAGRRLMDNENEPLPDYHQTMTAPGWEMDSRPVMTFQTTNEYASPLNTAPSGRGKWLAMEIGLRPAKNASPSQDHILRPKWHELEAKAVKWQSRRKNRGRPAIVAQRRKGVVRGMWLPSHAALWGEI